MTAPSAAFCSGRPGLLSNVSVPFCLHASFMTYHGTHNTSYLRHHAVMICRDIPWCTKSYRTMPYYAILCHDILHIAIPYYYTIQYLL